MGCRKMKLDFALWTREAVRMLIRQEYGIPMPVRTVGLYVQRWGFTPQKLVKFAYERNPVKVKAWLEEEFPVIKAQAKQERGKVYWGDETGLRAGDVRARGYAPKGKTPVVPHSFRSCFFLTLNSILSHGRSPLGWFRWSTKLYPK